MSRVGVTRFSSRKIQAIPSNDSFYWGDPGNSSNSRYSGAPDLSDNVTWGWHHPEGVYNSIPVGAPLIDSDMNIYLGADDAIRKFSVSGELAWSYAPRGQLAGAPSLLKPSARRAAAGSVVVSEGEAETQLLPTGAARSSLLSEDEAEENQLRPASAVPEEERLRPEWAGSSLIPDDEAERQLRPESARNGDARTVSLWKVKAGDRLKVKPGIGFQAGTKEYYKSGDEGEVAQVITGADGTDKAIIQWPRTSHRSVTRLSSLGNRFTRVDATERTPPSMLVGSTTSGYVFAIDLASGEELWATQPSGQIAGVKGTISGSNGIVVVATDRCVDRYCYKYRNTINPLMPGNSIVRGLLAIDGSEVWWFKPRSPVWNFVPQYSADGDSVMFSDFEGSTYCLDLKDGTLKWQVYGVMGTYTQAHALYFPTGNMIYAMGLHPYVGQQCNEFPAPGIQSGCFTQPWSPGWVRGLNASSGRQLWEKDVPGPPASSGVFQMYEVRHFRLIVTLGMNCQYNSNSYILALDTHTGDRRWTKEGPTLWSTYCAGDKDGGDIRRALGGRETCSPGSWSAPVMDAQGDIYVGNQVGELQRWGWQGDGRDKHVELLSTLNTGVAFQDKAIAFAPGMMAVSTCTSLIVFETSL